jgi:hypothetical protein
MKVVLRCPATQGTPGLLRLPVPIILCGPLWMAMVIPIEACGGLGDRAWMSVLGRILLKAKPPVRLDCALAGGRQGGEFQTGRSKIGGAFCSELTIRWVP